MLEKGPGTAHAGALERGRGARVLRPVSRLLLRGAEADGGGGGARSHRHKGVEAPWEGQRGRGGGGGFVLSLLIFAKVFGGYITVKEVVALLTRNIRNILIRPKI